MIKKYVNRNRILSLVLMAMVLFASLSPVLADNFTLAEKISDTASFKLIGFEGRVILDKEDLEIGNDENVLDFSKRILDENKIGYKADKGYFEGINGLNAFDKGKNSGWMFKIDEKMPEVGMGDIKVGKDMDIEIFFVEDFNLLFPEDGSGDVDELFVDMAKFSWASDAVNSLAIDNIVEGTGQNKFNPEKDVTRAEFATMISRAFKLKTTGKNNFKDIKKSDWYYEDVLKLANKGYINGREDGNFDPNGRITRQEIAVIFGNILKVEKVSLTDKEIVKNYKDYNEIAVWAVEGVGLSTQEELVKGIDGKFMPRKNANRAEAATMIYRFLERD